MQRARMVVDDGLHEDELQVGHFHIGPAAKERTRLGERRRHHAAALAEPLRNALSTRRPPRARCAKRFGVTAAAVGVHVVDVVLQVLADARQVDQRGDAFDCRWAPGPMPDSMQDLRRTEGAGAEHHFAAGIELHLLAVDARLHADHAVACDTNLRVSAPVTIVRLGRPRLGVEVGLGRAATLAVLLRHLVHEGAVLLGAVVVGHDRQPALARAASRNSLLTALGC